MLAVGLSEAQLSPFISAVVGQGGGNSLTCGCLNSPENTTVTGCERHIDELQRRSRAEGVFAQKLDVPVAYHSRQMEAVSEHYLSAIKNRLVSGTRTPLVLYSSVTGEETSSRDLTQAEYWVANLVSQVRFFQSLQLMCSSSRTGDGGGLIKENILSG